MADPILRFQRPGFHGEHAETIPKWHLLDRGVRSGTLVARCGYVWNDVFQDAKLSRAKTPPPRRAMCSRCLKVAVTMGTPPPHPQE